MLNSQNMTAATQTHMTFTGMPNHYNRKKRFGQSLFPDFTDFQIRALKRTVQLGQNPAIAFRICFHGRWLVVIDSPIGTDGAGDNLQVSQRNLSLRGTDDLLLEDGGVKILGLAVAPKAEVAHGIVDDAATVFLDGLKSSMVFRDVI